MGNQIKKIGGRVGDIIQYYDTPDTWNENNVPVNSNQNIQHVKDLNILLAKNVINLGSKLELDPNSITRNGPKWENSLVRGKIIVEIVSIAQNNSIIKEPNNEQSTQKKEQLDMIKPLQSSQKQQLNHRNQSQNNSVEQSQLSKLVQPNIRSYSIVLTLSQVYELRHMLQSYTKQQTQMQQKRRSFEGKLCVICLDHKPEKALPCAHQYCGKCIEQYVISKDLRCPMCRKSYRQSLANNVYQIVEWDQDFMQEMREIFYGIVQKNNPKQVKKIKKKIQANQMQKQKNG